MNVKTFIKKVGWQIDCDPVPCRYMNVNVAFKNNKGDSGETQFSIHAYYQNELHNLFKNFCKENKFPTNTVTCIAVVQMADTCEELS